MGSGGAKPPRDTLVRVSHSPRGFLGSLNSSSGCYWASCEQIFKKFVSEKGLGWSKSWSNKKQKGLPGSSVQIHCSENIDSKWSLKASVFSRHYEAFAEILHLIPPPSSSSPQLQWGTLVYFWLTCPESFSVGLSHSWARPSAFQRQAFDSRIPLSAEATQGGQGSWFHVPAPHIAMWPRNKWLPLCRSWFLSLSKKWARQIPSQRWHIIDNFEERSCTQYSFALSASQSTLDNEL